MLSLPHILIFIFANKKMKRSKLKTYFNEIINSDNVVNDRIIDLNILPQFETIIKSSALKGLVTPFILFVPNKCEACWKCIEHCNHDVLGKVVFLFHKHIKISKPDFCIGCMKCVNVCEHNALYKITNLNT